MVAALLDTPLHSCAFAILRSVKVARLSGKTTVLDDELEGIIHLTTVATLVISMDVSLDYLDGPHMGWAFL